VTKRFSFVAHARVKLLNDTDVVDDTQKILCYQRLSFVVSKRVVFDTLDCFDLGAIIYYIIKYLKTLNTFFYID